MYRYSSFSTNDSAIWMIIAAVLAVVGGILIYVLFLNRKNDGKFKGFWGWMYDFLSFRKMLLEIILKVTYLIIAIFVTLSSFALIGSSFIGFLAYLIIGNLSARLVYEFLLLLLVMCRNTSEINKKLDGKVLVNNNEKIGE